MVKALQTTRERAGGRALPKIEVDLSLAKKEFYSWLDKATDKIFFGNNAETFMECMIVFAGIYFAIHIIVALIKGWL